MAASDAVLIAAWEGVWSAWEDGTDQEPIPSVTLRALQAVAEAAVQAFAEEVMA